MNNSFESGILVWKLSTMAAGAAASATIAVMPELGPLAVHCLVGMVVGLFPGMWNPIHRSPLGVVRAVLSSGILGATVGIWVASVTGNAYAGFVVTLLLSLLIPELVARPLETIKKLIDLARPK